METNQTKSIQLFRDMNWSIEFILFYSILFYSIRFHSTTHSILFHSSAPIVYVLQITFSFLFSNQTFSTLLCLRFSFFVAANYFDSIRFHFNSKLFILFYFILFSVLLLYLIELYELVSLSHNRKGTERIEKEKKGMETNGKESKAKERRNKRNSKTKTN